MIRTGTSGFSFLIAPCAFKGTYGPFEIARAIARGVSRACPRSSVRILPIADGGDGTHEVLSFVLKARSLTSRVFDPLMRPIQAEWALTPNGKTAIIEMAQASGLKLLKPHEKDPLKTTSFGTGQLIREALARGARRVILGIGGSATVDGGVGALSALGFQFFDRKGKSLPPGGGSLRFLHRIDSSCVLAALKETEILIACDVKNPLCGPCGAAHVFGPQKGADPHEVKALEQGLRRLAAVIRLATGRRADEVTGGGAAGGFAGVFWGLGLARLISGFDLVAEMIQLDRWLRWADLIVTGEGSLDAQSFSGKAVGELVRRASRRKVPVIALAPRADLPVTLSRRYPNLKIVPLSLGERLVDLRALEKSVHQVFARELSRIV